MAYSGRQGEEASDGGYVSTYLVNAASGRSRTIFAADEATDIVLRASGGLAAIRETENGYRVDRVDARGRTLLDAGPGIRPRSLRLVGRRVAWQNGKRTHFAGLR